MSWFSRTKLFAICLGLAALAACQPLPRPFAPPPHDRNSALLEQSDHGGIVVLAVAGIPDALSHTIAASMAKALRKLEIPAATGGGNSRSRFLQGWATTERIAGGRIRITLDWDLFDRGGRVIGSQPVRREVAAWRWEGGDRALLDELATAAAGVIASLVQEPAEAGAAATERPALHVGAVGGAPGDGGRALRTAMRRALRGAGYRISDAPKAGGMIVTGQVNLTAANRNREMVEIVWQVRSADGGALGKLTQRNAVQKGSLDGSWGRIAQVIADNAVGGLGDLLRRLPAR